MKKDTSQIFLEKLREVQPHNPTLTNQLTQILHIEKEAVYRRLRGEVPFSFNEAGKIADYFAISLDELVSTDKTLSKRRPFRGTMCDHLNLDETDYQLLEGWVNLLRVIIPKEKWSNYYETSILFPQSFYQQFNDITRMYRFRLNYQLRPFHERIPFKEITIPEKLREYQLAHARLAKNFKNTYHIFDRNIFQYFVEDVKYYYSINMMDAEDVLQVKEDLLRMTDYIEQLAARGRFAETGNKVDIYISNVCIDSNYWYFESETTRSAQMNMFMVNAVYTEENLMFNRCVSWIQSIKRSSTLISESGEKQRIEYFDT